MSSHADDSAFSAKYLDMLDFFTLDIATLSKQDAKALGDQHEIDEKSYESFRKVYENVHHDIQEKLIYMHIDKLNFYTSYIDLALVYEYLNLNTDMRLLNSKKRMIVDMYTLRSLNREHVINWLNCTTALYPIQAIGNGNCLCNAVLTYITGMQDTNLWLRDTLKQYMNLQENRDKLKERWLADRKTFYDSEASELKIEVNDKILENEWSEMLSMKRKEPTSSSPENNSVVPDHQNELPAGSAPLSASTTSTEPLIYLEDIHIFGLANLLCRPIIVLAQEFYKNIEPIRLRGIYLPLLVPPRDCVKDPILIAYHNNHFVPVMFALDEADVANFRSLAKDSGRVVDENALRTRNSARYFHFENVENFDSQNMDVETYQMLVQSHLYKNEVASSSLVGYKKRENSFFNVIPLVHADQRPMRVHFIGADEKKSEKRLNEYLNLISLDVELSSIEGNSRSAEQAADQRRAGDVDTEKRLDIKCCFLSRSSELCGRKNGISIYLSFLNDCIKRARTTRTSHVLSSDSENFDSKSFMHRTAKSYSESLGIKGCRESGCSNEGKERWRGYCFNCYKNNAENLSSEAEARARHQRQHEEEEERERANRRVEQILEEQRNQRLNTAKQRTIIEYPSLNMSSRREFDNETTKTQELEIINSSTSYRPQSSISSQYTSRINLCANPDCREAIVSSQFKPSEEPSLYCLKCQERLQKVLKERLDYQRDLEREKQKYSSLVTRPLSSSQNRLLSSSTRNTGAIHLPIRIQSGPQAPAVSAYDDARERSRLYDSTRTSATKSPFLFSYDHYPPCGREKRTIDKDDINQMIYKSRVEPVRHLICRRCQGQFSVPLNYHSNPVYCEYCAPC